MDPDTQPGQQGRALACRAAQEFNIPVQLAEILRRGFDTLEALRDFLHPQLAMLPAPDTMKGMPRRSPACARPTARGRRFSCMVITMRTGSWPRRCCSPFSGKPAPGRCTTSPTAWRNGTGCPGVHRPAAGAPRIGRGRGARYRGLRHHRGGRGRLRQPVRPRGGDHRSPRTPGNPAARPGRARPQAADCAFRSPNSPAWAWPFSCSWPCARRWWPVGCWPARTCRT